MFQIWMNDKHKIQSGRQSCGKLGDGGGRRHRQAWQHGLCSSLKAECWAHSVHFLTSCPYPSYILLSLAHACYENFLHKKRKSKFWKHKGENVNYTNSFTSTENSRSSIIAKIHICKLPYPGCTPSLKNPTWSSRCGSAVINPPSIHTDTGSIPGLYQWVKDPEILWAVV